MKLNTPLKLMLLTSFVANAATPVNMSLGSGLSWSLATTPTYDTGTKATETGGYNGQTSGPYNDTSFGVMDETGAPWYTGNDVSDQQFTQIQQNTNYGTNSPPGPSGFRFYNNSTPAITTVNMSSTATAAGTNFPANATETRAVSLNNWNNTKPDVSGTAVLGQQVYVPISASLEITRGYGADEMYLAVSGGTGGNNTTLRLDYNIYSMMGVSAYSILEGEAGDRDYINDNMTVTMNNAGIGGAYGFNGSQRIAYGYGINTSDPSLDQSNRLSFTQDNAARKLVVSDVDTGLDPGQGIPSNSVGTSISQNYDVLSSLIQNGSAFSVEFQSQVEMFISNYNGNGGTWADPRFSMGPGMAGNARLVVTYQVWEAVPETSSSLLGVFGAALLFRRKRI